MEKCVISPLTFDFFISKVFVPEVFKLLLRLLLVLLVLSSSKKFFAYSMVCFLSSSSVSFCSTCFNSTVAEASAATGAISGVTGSAFNIIPSFAASLP